MNVSARRQRNVYAYLLIEDRAPRSYSAHGNAVASHVYLHKPDRGTVPAGARVLPIHIVLPPGFFDPEPVQIVVPGDAPATGEAS